MATRPLHFIWICDTSGSMAGQKIETLNTGVREAIEQMQHVALENPNADVQVRVVTFSDGARWVVSQPTPVASFQWTDLAAGGQTDMGKAMKLVADQMKIPPMSERALPPVLALITDGQPTDDFAAGLRALMSERWGQKAVRVAISVGHDTNLDTLQKFIGHSEIPPIEANNPEALVRSIRWVSTAVLKAASSPASQPAGGTMPNVPVVVPPNLNAGSSPNDVW